MCCEDALRGCDIPAQFRYDPRRHYTKHACDTHLREIGFFLFPLSYHHKQCHRCGRDTHELPSQYTRSPHYSPPHLCWFENSLRLPLQTLPARHFPAVVDFPKNKQETQLARTVQTSPLCRYTSLAQPAQIHTARLIVSHFLHRRRHCNVHFDRMKEKCVTWWGNVEAC